MLNRYDPLDPGPVICKKLAHEWNLMGDVQQKSLRANRAKMGIKCSDCGTIGFYREMCPNNCINRPRTPDSDDTPPPSPAKKSVCLGILWNLPKNNKTIELEGDDDAAAGGKFNIAKLRADSLSEVDRLRVADKDVGRTEFFRRAQEGYHRNLPELTLHQVMRRLMRLLENELTNNFQKLEAAKDETLLLPSKDSSETFYPEELKKFKDYKEYFMSKELKKGGKKNYQYRGSYRTDDGNTSLDPFESDPDAGSSMHSKMGWKSILSISDQLATSDPKIIKKMKEVKQLVIKQGIWVSMQKKSMEQKNDRFEHLVHVLKSEMSNEHAREARFLSANKRMSKKESMKIWQDRFSSVDKIIETLSVYGFTSGVDELDWLKYCLDQWKHTSGKKVIAMQGGTEESSVATGLGA